MAKGVRIVALPNGARLLMAPDTNAVAVEVASWFEGGTSAERPGTFGFTRLLEGWMARGAGGESLTRLVLDQGGTPGSFHTPDLICFYETLPPRAFELGLRIEADRMRTLPGGAAELEAARARARLESSRRTETGPAPRGLRRLFDALYPGQPDRGALTAADSNLASASAEDCDRFFSARFTPGRALVTVVGRFDTAAVLRAAQATVGAVPAREATVARGARPALAAERRVWQPGEQQIPILYVGWRAPGPVDPRSPALDLLGRVLAGGAGARLGSAFAGRDRPVLFAQGGYVSRRSGSLFYAMAVLAPVADSATIERDLVSRVEALASAPVSASELERARRQAESEMLLGWQGAHGRTLALGTSQLVTADYRNAWSRLDAIRRVSAADLQRAAAGVLTRGGATIVWMTPAGNWHMIPMEGGAR